MIINTYVIYQKCIDEVYIGYFNNDEKMQFTYFLNNLQDETYYDFFKKVFYFHVKKLYELYKQFINKDIEQIIYTTQVV